MSSLSVALYQKLKSYGSLTALKCNDKIVSYDELNEKALAIATLLIEQGARNEAVGIVGQRSLDSYFGILGTIYAGCYWVPINTKYTFERINSIVNSANINYFIGEKSAIEAIIPILKSNNSGHPVKLVIVPEGRDVVEQEYIGSAQLEKVLSIDYPFDSNDNNLAYIMFTSGSTGMPKGVKVSRANIAAWLANMNYYYKFDAGFIASQTYDLSFDLSVADIVFTWANGGVLSVLSPEEHLMPIDYIKRERIKLWSSVPTLISFMYKMGQLKPDVFPDVEISIFCGEPLPKYLADAWKIAAPNSTIENLYGPTEATIWLTRYNYTEKQSAKSFNNSILPIGLPFKNHVVEIISERDELLTKGQVGEIVYKGPQITEGYLNEPSTTKEVFVKFNWDLSGEIWYKSGDLGFFNSDGNLECIGRKDGQIKLGGRRIEVGEIESVLRLYPQIVDAVVVPIRDDFGVVNGIVAFSTTEVSKVDESRIRKDSEQYLERIFFPKVIFTIKEFPLTTSGKIDRKTLAIIARNNYNSL